MKPKIGDAVLVEWEDSYGCSSSWQSIDPSGQPRVLICESVGWIVQRTAKCIVLVPHMTARDDVAQRQGCGDMTIPTASIIRLTQLSLKGQKRAISRPFSC